MSKVIVIYRSKSGYTKKYAEWIAKAVDADLVESRDVSRYDLLTYDTIVYGGALYAIGINGINFVKKHILHLNNKRIIVFTLGATPLHKGIPEAVRNSNFSAEQQKHISFFMLRGGFDFNKLTLADKGLMSLLKAKLKFKRNRTADERGMLAAYTQTMDFTDEKLITPIVKAIHHID